jgi:phosphonopyruvate decarboxylase
VPCSYFTPLVNFTTSAPELDYLSATSEGEAVAIAAGLVAAGRPAFVLMQNSGLGNAVNPITSLLYIYKIPLVLLISHRGQPGQPDEPQHLLMGRITEELTELCGVRTHIFEAENFESSLGEAQRDGVAAAWICRKGSFEGGVDAQQPKMHTTSRVVRPATQGHFEPSLNREEALAAVAPLLNRGLDGADNVDALAVVSTTGKTSRELYELDDSDHSKTNRFYMVGSMGCAAGFGLGVSRGQAQRRVVVIDGDGSLLMKLGSLATIGHVGPSNLHHLVLDNGAHDSTGAQPTASPTVDLAAVALACGYRHAETVDDPDRLVEALERHVQMDGPTLLRMVIRTGARKDLGRPDLAPQAVWTRFSDFLQRLPAKR